MWKNLRLSLNDDAPEDDKLARVARFWGQCPIQRHALDTDRPSTWMTCWEMLHYNDFDKNAIAVGMEMTLRLAGWAADRLMLIMIMDQVLDDMFMVLKIDDAKLLNYNLNCVSKLPESGFEVLKQYQYVGKCYSMSP